MKNPYEPPKVLQEPAAEKRDFFERMQRYQYRMFYVGIVVSVLSAVATAMEWSPILTQIFRVISVLGVLMLFVSLGSILPLAIWGFVKGYRESRKP